MSEKTCDLCGTVWCFEDDPEPMGEIQIEFHKVGIASISAVYHSVCYHCMKRLLPSFESLADECMPLRKDPYELARENQHLKNRIAQLQSRLRKEDA